jgi:hypothetical protein
MNSRKTESLIDHLYRSTIILFGIAVTLSFSACARKPWREPLADDGRKTVLQVINEMHELDAARSNCIDSDVNIFFTSHVKNRAVSGYLQLLQPDSVKFVSSNPFGQPLFAFVSTGSFFQFVNTLEQYFMDGGLYEFARIYDIPPFAISSSWGQWLTARLPETSDIIDIRRDSADRGFWVSINTQTGTQENESEQKRTEHILIDSENKLLLSRIFTGPQGRTEAEISYSDWLNHTSNEDNRQPGMITISGLDYGGEIVLKFSALQPMEGCIINDFSLQRPRGYQYQALPYDY